ncbi:sensor histidine kinase, partial [Streptococcus pyogenes]
LGSETDPIGSLEVQSVGPFAYTEHDALFLADMRNNLIFVAIGSLIISLFFALLIAKKLSSPIVRIQNFTTEIAKGHYSQLAIEETGIQEID